MVDPYRLIALEELFAEDDAVAAGPNTRAMLEQLHDAHLACRTGGMKMRGPTESRPVSILGRPLSVSGSLWDIYRITPAGRAALRESDDG